MVSDRPIFSRPMSGNISIEELDIERKDDVLQTLPKSHKDDGV